MRNAVPLALSILFIGIICVFVVLRMRNQNLWAGSAVNGDLVFAAMYLIWLGIESKVSKKELSKGRNRSDYGTCELYAIGQAGVFLSALWFESLWKAPTAFHVAGFAVFVLGVLFRLWAVGTLGKYYSHMVRVVDAHRIIDSGPYRYVRHPAYGGMILANCGVVLFYLNLVTLCLFLFLLVPAIIIRIHIEEKMLFNIEGYAQFAERRKRILPAIW